MAMQNKQKDRLRHVIRTTMVAIALLLLFWAVVLPIINNGKISRYRLILSWWIPFLRQDGSRSYLQICSISVLFW